MRAIYKFIAATVFAVLAGCASTGTTTAPAEKAAGVQSKEGWYTNIVDVEFVKQYAVVPKPDGVMIIDARPTGRKYDPGHIPTAINIPDTDFDKKTDLLPKDKATLLIYYCEGVECMLSHKSAYKAEKLGYTNIKVFAHGYPGWIKDGNIGAVSVAYIKKLIDEKAPMVLIDSRPKARKYDKGHIPGAISLPDSEFDKLAASKLPADKAAALYFYCEGVTCKLSSTSAEKAMKLGYSNVKVVPEGYPAWVKAYGPGPTEESTAPAAPVVQAGKESGTIAVASFEQIMKEAPDSIMLIDVRDPGEYANGTFKGAVNIPVGEVEKKVDTLPAGKTIVFFCGAGGRSGEAHDMVKLLRPELKTYFINAQITFKKDGTYSIVENK